MAFQQNSQLEMDCFLLAGKLLMQSGAEAYRTEDTMHRMAASQGYTAAKSFVTPTGILFSAGDGSQTKIAEINKRSIDLEKIARINEVLRKLTAHHITIEEAYEALQYIERSNFSFSNLGQILFAALASGSFVILFMGRFIDIPAATVAGGLGYTAFLFFNWMTKVKFFAEFAASIVIGFITVLAVKYGLGNRRRKSIKHQIIMFIKKRKSVLKKEVFLNIYPIRLLPTVMPDINKKM